MLGSDLCSGEGQKNFIHPGLLGQKKQNMDCASIPRSLRRYIPVTLTHDTLGNREVGFKNQRRAYKYDRSQGSAGKNQRRKRRHPSAQEPTALKESLDSMTMTCQKVQLQTHSSPVL